MPAVQIVICFERIFPLFCTTIIESQRDWSLSLILQGEEPCFSRRYGSLRLYLQTVPTVPSVPYFCKVLGAKSCMPHSKPGLGIINVKRERDISCSQFCEWAIFEVGCFTGGKSVVEIVVVRDRDITDRKQ